MEIKINVDDSMLKEFGLGGIAEEVAKSFAPQFRHTIFRGLRPNFRMMRLSEDMGHGVESPKMEIATEMKPEISKDEIKSIEDAALLNLKKDVKKILTKKEGGDLVTFILDKLDASALGKLIQK